MRRPDRFSLSAICALHLVTLFTLAVAQPVYDALSRADHTSFLAAHRVGAADIWLLVALLSVLLPGSACVLLWLVRPLSRM
jgi:hypothetical protein